MPTMVAQKGQLEWDPAALIAEAALFDPNADVEEEPLEVVDADGPKTYTREQLAKMGMDTEGIQALVDAGLVSDAEQGEEAARNPLTMPETPEDVAKVVLRVRRIEERRERLKRQFERRDGREKGRLEFYQKLVWPLCIEIVEQALPPVNEKTGKRPRSNIDLEDLRLQLKAYQHRFSIEDVSKVLSWMHATAQRIETLGNDISGAECYLRNSVGDQSPLPQRLADMQIEKARLERALTGLIDGYTLKLVQTKTMPKLEGWRWILEYPEVFEFIESLNAEDEERGITTTAEYVEELDKKHACKVLLELPPVSGYDAQGEIVDEQRLVPPGATYHAARNELYWD